MTALEQIREQALEIEAQRHRLQVLLEAILEKVDESDQAKALGAIDCFATCALRSVALINEHHLHILLLAKGGAR